MAVQGQADRIKYLQTKQAKIVAMTCTHAALKRREFLDIGFKYDNLLMEESAQILEIESFIPMLLQVCFLFCTTSEPQLPHALDISLLLLFTRTTRISILIWVQPLYPSKCFGEVDLKFESRLIVSLQYSSCRVSFF